MEVIICHYEENLNWITETQLQNVIIYSNEKDYVYTSYPYNKIVKLSLPKCEAYTYFYHIIKNYDQLANFTVFTNGNPINTYPKFIEVLKQINPITCKLEKFEGKELTMEMDNANQGFPMHIKIMLNELIIDPSNIISFTNNIFGLSKELILAKPKAFYEKCLEYVEYTKNPLEGRIFERLWLTIFNLNKKPNLEIYRLKQSLNNTIDHIQFSYLFDDISKTLLEIGPFNNSRVKNRSTNYKSLDYITYDEMIKNKDPAIYGLNPFIRPDYVIPRNKTYKEIIPDTFDIIVSSHNIEHTPCLITFLNNLSSVLNATGKIYLAIPDYRYCFDSTRGHHSLISDFLEAYYQKHDKPSLKSYLEHILYHCDNKPPKLWSGDKLDVNNLYKFCKTEIDGIVENNYNKNPEVDCHVWKFTPHSFFETINYLYKLKYIDLQIDKVYNTLTNSVEFYAVLKK